MSKKIQMQKLTGGQFNRLLAYHELGLSTREIAKLLGGVISAARVFQILKERKDGKVEKKESKEK